MANSFKKKYETPIGDLVYVMITGKGKLKMEGDEDNPLDYEYQACLDLNPEKHATVKEQIESDLEKFWQQAKEKLGIKKKSPDWIPIKYSKDEETGEPISETAQFVAKTAANWKDKQSGEIRPQIIPIYDGLGNNVRQLLLSKNVSIGNGSRGIIYCTLMITRNKANGVGITAYLEAVQVAKLIPYKPGEVSKDRLKKLDEAEAINLDDVDVPESETQSDTAELASEPQDAPDVEV